MRKPTQEKTNTKKLSTSFILVLLFLIMIIGFMLFFFYNQQLAQEANRNTLAINSLLQNFMEEAMLKHDIDRLRQIVQKLETYPYIHLVIIINNKQKISFSSDPTLLDSNSQNNLNKQFSFQVNSRNEKILRTVNPIFNQETCTHCHGSIAEHPINGVLLIDYNAEPMLENAFYNTLLLMLISLFIGSLLIIIFWWFIRQNNANETTVDIHDIASKIAHDIYNPLTSVRLSVQSALRTLENEQLNVIYLAEDLKIVDSEIDKCVEITQGLLKNIEN